MLIYIDAVYFTIGPSTQSDDVESEGEGDSSGGMLICLNKNIPMNYDVSYTK